MDAEIVTGESAKNAASRALLAWTDVSDRLLSIYRYWRLAGTVTPDNEERLIAQVRQFEKFIRATEMRADRLWRNEWP